MVAPSHRSRYSVEQHVPATWRMKHAVRARREPAERYLECRMGVELLEKDKSRTSLVPGWWFNVEEVSACHYVLTGIDQDGRRVSCEGTDVSNLMRTGRNYAVNIALQVSKNKHKFLYEYFLQRLVDDKLSESKYDEKVFGSWIIYNLNTRIVLDGKESLLIVQVQNNGDWEDLEVEDIKSITPEKINSFIKLISNVD